VDLLTREWDLMELPGGEILTVVGTYRSTRARGQLTYVPDDDGGLEIFGRRYRKTSFEIWGEIPYGKQVLALPGRVTTWYARPTSRGTTRPCRWNRPGQSWRTWWRRWRRLTFRWRSAGRGP